MNLFLWPAMAFFTFYKGYHALCQGPNHVASLKWYKCMQIVSLVFYGIFMFIRSGAFNGFMKLPILNECGQSFAMFLSVVEIVLYAILVVLSVFSYMLVKKHYGTDSQGGTVTATA